MKLWTRQNIPQASQRPGAVILLFAVILVVLFGFVAFTVDYGYMTIVKSELQNAADASALASTAELSEASPRVRRVAKEVARANTAAGDPVSLRNSQITPGLFDFNAKTFTPSSTSANAVKIRTRVIDRPLFFAPVIGRDRFSLDAEAIAMINPRDIVIVVDLSGSMNDDVEPAWATQAIADRRIAAGQSPAVATNMVTTLYNDFGFGAYPGAEEYVGEPLGVPQDVYAYAEMTDDAGPLTDPALDDRYRILASDSEITRKYKAYAWMIDNQLARLMPDARPVPSSTSTVSALFWEKYLDYVIFDRRVGEPPPSPPSSGGGGGSSPPSPPSGPRPPVGLRRGHAVGMLASAYPGTPRQGSTAQSSYIPPNRDDERMTRMNNPNEQNYVNAVRARIWQHVNRLGYRTYVQFMLDFGRDRSPDIDNDVNADESFGTKSQLSVLSPYCRYHNEYVGSRLFQFPPRTQPMHACRRSLIRTMQTLQTRNASVGLSSADRIAVVTFDGLDSYHWPEIVVPFTHDYGGAMTQCTELQAVSDIGNTTGTEVGLKVAREMLRPKSEGGSSRSYAKKVIILLTDGVPNAYDSSQATIDAHIVTNPSSNYYDASYPWYNSALMQVDLAAQKGVEVYAVGMGIGSDYDFLDRVARLGRTDEGGQAPRSSGDPTAYEAQVTAILEEIIRNAGTRLVK